MNTGYNPNDAIKSSISYRFLGLCFILGAITGTAGDAVHVITGVDKYSQRSAFPFLPLLPVDIPVWVPFLFGGAVVLMGIVHKIFSRSFKPRLSSNRTLSSIAPLIFLSLYALSGLVDAGTGGLQDVWLALAAILFWAVADGTPVGAALALLIAVCGTMFEIFLVSVHGFSYYPKFSNLLGVPSWLPWLYVSASVAVSLVIRWI